MKKCIYIVIIVILTIIFVGCNKKDEVVRDNLSFDEWATENLEMFNEIKKIDCVEIKESSIMSGSNEIFITGNNIYKYNTDKLFSNDKNCKLIGSFDDSNFVAVSGSNAIDESGILYNDFWQRVDDDNYDGPYFKDDKHTGWVDYFKRFDINKMLLSGNDRFSSDEERHIPPYEIITYIDGELYAYYIDFMNYSAQDGKEFKYKINIDEIKDEKILRLYGSFVKTDKAYYMLTAEAINKDKCEKYVDVDCEYNYVLKKDEILTKYYDEILNITDEYFITKDFKLISVMGYTYIP